MDMRNCGRCGKLFGYVSGMPICPACKEKDEEAFTKVKKYLYDNPGAPLSVVAEACEVSIEKITRFLREGRLEIMSEGNLILECEGCGKGIKSGKYCSDCEKTMHEDLRSTAKKVEKENQQNNNQKGYKIL